MRIGRNPAAARSPAIGVHEVASRDLTFGLTRVLGGPPDDATLMGLWAITSPEVYAKLTHAGWDRDVYESWLAATLDRHC